MHDQLLPEDRIPAPGRNACQDVRTEQQEFAASIERDFRSLLDSLGHSQSIDDSKIAADIERVKALVERGIDLSLRLRTVTDAER